MSEDQPHILPPARLPLSKPSVKISFVGSLQLPRLIADAGDDAIARFLEFFAANIRNPNTRKAYLRNALAFLRWCEARDVADLKQIRPFIVAAYIEEIQLTLSKPSVKQHLASIRMLFDWLVTGQIVPVNPASSVRGPKYVVKVGKTPILTAAETRQLLDGIDGSDVLGLRDKAIIASMVYSFARVGAMVAMRVEDYYIQGRRSRVRLHEKGGKLHTVPAHHNLEAYMDAYIEKAGIADDRKGPLFRTANGKTKTLNRLHMRPADVWRMIRRRAKQAGIKTMIGCHSFRATGITCYMSNGGTLENAQMIAGHESPRTTKLYNRSADEVTLDEVERIVI